MLNISDGELLQLCRSTIEAATAGLAEEELLSKPLSSAVADSLHQTRAAFGQPQPATSSEPVPTQPDSPQTSKPELAEDLLEQTDTLLRKDANRSTAFARAHISRSSDTAEGSGDLVHVTASLAPAASAAPQYAAQGASCCCRTCRGVLVPPTQGPVSAADAVLMPGSSSM